MANQLSMKYDEMEKAIKQLKTECGNFQQTTKNMTTQVTNLCNNWTADASPVYKADYQKLTKNFTKTLEVVKSLISSTEKYLSDMKALDQAYSSSKVQ